MSTGRRINFFYLIRHVIGAEETHNQLQLRLVILVLFFK